MQTSHSSLILLIFINLTIYCQSLNTVEPPTTTNRGTNGKSTVERGAKGHGRQRNVADNMEVPVGGPGAHQYDQYDSHGATTGGGGMCEIELTCKSSNGQVLPGNSVKLPVRGPRGQPGPQGDKGDRGEDGATGLPGLPGQSAPVPLRVAFFVGLSDNLGPVTDHSDVVFDRVVTNIGNAYNKDTGRFTAPVNATFQFNVVISAQGKQRAAVMIVKNGEMIATVWAESIPYWATASNVAVLSLERGDQVWLLLLNRASHLHGYMYTTFSGFLIFEN